jgi:hypothetical protein
MTDEQESIWPKITPKQGSLLPIKDPLAYTENRCSKNAKKIKTLKSSVSFEMWHEKHYAIRMQFGDNDGKREGIDAHIIEALISRSLKHILAYSSIIKTFAPVNYSNVSERSERIVLKEESEHGMLNVAIEIHLISPEVYEITVLTAMCSDTYKLSDGQFAIQLTGNESVIMQYSRGATKQIHNL